ncbi:MAG TPA: M14 family zinc carboxypeptidase [Oceanipulchritudo sp.]|nr:M14 family zinc carboxypeptidase [Oceanipulchritudo sp.]
MTTNGMRILLAGLLGWNGLSGFEGVGPVAGERYRDSVELTERWFTAPEVTFAVPGAEAGRWTTVEEAYARLEELAAEGARLTVREVGESLLGVPIKALFHEGGRADAATVLLQARVHGNEPATTEGLLEIAWQLAEGELRDLELNVILVPVLNPEGAREMERRTGTDIDPNRDYVLQQSAAVRTVYRLLRDYDPEVVVDLHEHSRYPWPYDLMTIGPNNPNIPEALRAFTDEVVIGGMREAFLEAGLRLGPYRILDFPEEGVRVRESATTFVSEKNAIALGGRINLLTEGRGVGLGNQHYHRRTLSQYTAMRSLLETVAKHEAEVREVVAGARAAIAEGMEEWILRVEPVKKKAQHDLLSAETQDVETVSTTYWDRTGGTVAAKLAVPEAYVIDASEAALMDRLLRFGLEAERVSEATEMTVDILTVEHFNAGRGQLYGGRMKRADGTLERLPVRRNHDITVRTRGERREIPAGSWIIRTAQPKALYLIALEPESYSGFAASSYWGETLPEGFEFPVYRLRR